MEKKKLIYKNSNYTANFNNLRLNKKFCDVTIKVNEMEFHAHRCVLAANLKYFETMFSSDSFQEGKQDVVDMKGLEKADLEPFLVYAYTGELLLTEENALDLLHVANYLGEDPIKDACSEFLQKHLKSEDACRVYRLAYNIDCLSLRDAAKTMIVSKFEDCSQASDYLDFKCEQLMDILCDGKKEPTESQPRFFEGIMRWMVHDVKERRIRMNDLLNLIDVGRMKADDLIDYLYKNVIDSKDEHDILKDVMFCYHTMKNLQSKEQVLLLTCRDNGTLQFQVCDLKTKKWSSLHKIPYCYDHAVCSTTAILKNELYYISENIKGHYLNVFNPAKKRCTTLVHSKKLMSSSALVACEKYLYICGGRPKDDTESDQLLRYDPSTNSLETLTPMPYKVSRAASIYYRGCLHVVGGTFKMYNTLVAIARYDPKTKRWSTVPNMNHGCTFNNAVAELDGKLYVCGHHQRRSVEVYDPTRSRWRNACDMKRLRDNFLAIGYEGKLLAIGGDHYNVSIEVYDPAQNEWKLDEELSAGLQIQNPQGGLITNSFVAHYFY